MNAENPADVIEQAARALHDQSECGDPYGTCISTSEYYRDEARALHDAGLLADPADRDERDHLRERAELAELDRRTYQFDAKRAIAGWERAEAEVARLKADFAKLRAEHTFKCGELDRAYEERDELRATVERVRALADEWAGFGTHTWFRQIHVTAAESLRAALDGTGDAPNQQIGEQR